MTYADGTYMKFADNVMVRIDVPIGYWVASEKIATLDELADGEFVGVWTNPTTGITYFDKTMWIESLAMAKFIGERYNQLAIWDCENETEVWLNEFFAEQLAE